jgi:hypothetical protein
MIVNDVALRRQENNSQVRFNTRIRGLKRRFFSDERHDTYNHLSQILFCHSVLEKRKRLR